jgi:hypothetical protein
MTYIHKYNMFYFKLLVLVLEIMPRQFFTINYLFIRRNDEGNTHHFVKPTFIIP